MPSLFKFVTLLKLSVRIPLLGCTHTLTQTHTRTYSKPTQMIHLKSISLAPCHACPDNGPPSFVWWTNHVYCCCLWHVPRWRVKWGKCGAERENGEEWETETRRAISSEKSQHQDSMRCLVHSFTPSLPHYIKPSSLLKLGQKIDLLSGCACKIECVCACVWVLKCKYTRPILSTGNICCSA